MGAEDPRVSYLIVCSLVNKYHWLVYQVFKGFFCGPLVLQTFTAHFNAINGAVRVAGLEDEWAWCVLVLAATVVGSHMLMSCMILTRKRPNEVWLYGQQGQLCCKWCLMPKAWDAPNLILKAIITLLSWKHSSMIMALKNWLPSAMSLGQEQLASIWNSSLWLCEKHPSTRLLKRPRGWWLVCTSFGWMTL